MVDPSETPARSGDVDKIHDAVEDMRKHVAAMAISAASMDATLRGHMDNSNIHHGPPCGLLSSLTAKLWGLGVLAISNLIALIVMLSRGD